MADQAGPEGPQRIEAEMVLIPAGEFLMGADNGEDDSPIHQVYIDAFDMDRFEVTNAEYLAFCEDQDWRLPEFWGREAFHSTLDFPNYPVVGISWSDARTYAEWAGKRLPTEAEWECAARGGLVGMIYPHGDSIDPTWANYRWSGIGGTVAVGRYPPNGFGLHDMAGNVVEWVADCYSADYYKISPPRNPQGPEKGKFRVIRGGGWHSGPSCNRVHFRNALPANWKDLAVGFRCARDQR
ncbi:MAG: SUMF1/EgtB/PvdO family nonheme iron enzyme [Anaerolineae bacterium]|nr:SUMF1/EgtB/PvdO family nonheme iron enzyme [Anaerolineae bacterium]NIN97451.1 SUMF1/EgtB/PvdO family nonheme iron enzyme [Anaerolineae bacterium]NIQ80380.1 SUMF1/EgtB/PvdO family nonheme iron enzyme [Anaerolineae bacterium]